MTVIILIVWESLYSLKLKKNVHSTRKNTGEILYGHKDYLWTTNPLTEEMQMLFQDIIYAIENKETFIAILEGAAGTGKSTFV